MPAMDLMEHTAKVIQDVLNTHERRHPEIGAKAALGWLVARMTEAAAAAAWRNPGFTGRDRALFHGRAEALQAYWRIRFSTARAPLLGGAQRQCWSTSGGTSSVNMR